MGHDQRQKRSFLPAVLVAVCVLYSVLAKLGYTDDFRAFYLASSATLHHLDPYQNNDALGSAYADPLWPWPDSRFVYPPTALFFFLPLALLPYGIAKVLFGLSTALCASASILLLRARLSTPAWVWTLLVLSMPVFLCIDNGQIECHLLLLLLAAFLLGDSALAGVLWGLAVSIKLSPVLLALWWIGAKRWKTLITGLFVAVALALAACLVWGRAYFSEFQQHLRRHAVWNSLPVVPHIFYDLKVVGRHVVTPHASYTLSYELFGWFQNPLRHLGGAAQAVGLLVVVVTAGLLFLTRRGRRLGTMESFAVFLAVTPLANPLLWPMGLVACLPLTGVLLSSARPRLWRAVSLLVPLFAPKLVFGNLNYAFWLTAVAAVLITDHANVSGDDSTDLRSST